MGTCKSNLNCCEGKQHTINVIEDDEERTNVNNNNSHRSKTLLQEFSYDVSKYIVSLK